MGMVREVIASTMCDELQRLLLVGAKLNEPEYSFCCQYVLPTYLNYCGEAVPPPNTGLHGQIVLMYKDAIEECDRRVKEVADILSKGMTHGNV
jgi:hypothetical protein